VSRKRVAILYRYVPQYRLEFYRRLYALCKNSDIDLDVIYGNPSKTEKTKGHAVSFEPGQFIKNKFYSVGHTELIWQPVLAEIRSADLVIAEQANKLLINYLLLARQFIGIQKFAFFGHGKDFQATKQDNVSEALKKRLVRLPHWWFAYTPGVARLVEAAGFPSDRITVFYNAIDTKALANFRAEITGSELSLLRERIGITSENVCIYVGGMYPEKRIPFLLESCEHIRALIPDFQMLFIGAGPDDHLVRHFCDSRRWAIYIGPLVGREKVKHFMISKLMLMPGLVGLAVLDTFALGVPIVTTDVPFHSPEIDYLENGHNGVIVTPAEDLTLYASTVVDLLLNEAKRTELVAGCERSAPLYTIENMAKCFFDGMVRALSIK
jgi:glycosyltransferase involved in cell wall biosynthesis